MNTLKLFFQAIASLLMDVLQWAAIVAAVGGFVLLCWNYPMTFGGAFLMIVLIVIVCTRMEKIKYDRILKAHRERYEKENSK